MYKLVSSVYSCPTVFIENLIFLLIFIGFETCVTVQNIQWPEFKKLSESKMDNILVMFYSSQRKSDFKRFHFQQHDPNHYSVWDLIFSQHQMLINTDDHPLSDNQTNEKGGSLEKIVESEENEVEEELPEAFLPNRSNDDSMDSVNNSIIYNPDGSFTDQFEIESSSYVLCTTYAEMIAKIQSFYSQSK